MVVVFLNKAQAIAMQNMYQQLVLCLHISSLEILIGMHLHFYFHLQKLMRFHYGPSPSLFYMIYAIFR